MTIEFKWPWTMVPLERADVWIAQIQKGIKPGNVLYGKKIFPSGYREDKKVILIENDDDGSYAFLSYIDPSKEFTVEVVLSPQDVMKVINQNHAQAVKAYEGEN